MSSSEAQTIFLGKTLLKKTKKDKIIYLNKKKDIYRFTTKILEFCLTA